MLADAYTLRSPPVFKIARLTLLALLVARKVFALSRKHLRRTHFYYNYIIMDITVATSTITIVASN